MERIEKKNLKDGVVCGDSEFVDIIASGIGNYRLERIVSFGDVSPAGFWYNQDEEEFVAVLEGNATLEFFDGEKIEMLPLDYIVIPAHKKHRVLRTSKTPPCIWLAFFVER